MYTLNGQIYISNCSIVCAEQSSWVQYFIQTPKWVSVWSSDITLIFQFINKHEYISLHNLLMPIMVFSQVGVLLCFFFFFGRGSVFWPGMMKVYTDVFVFGKSTFLPLHFSTISFFFLSVFLLFLAKLLCLGIEKLAACN